MVRETRKVLRLREYDYSGAGYYFVTLCVKDRRALFWDTARAGLEPAPTNPFGKVVEETWRDLPLHIPGVRVDQYVVMPNHFHGIVILENGLVGPDPNPAQTRISSVGAGSKPARTPISLSEVIRQLKTFSARRINQMRATPGAPVWQRGFYDHIIRSEADYLRIWDYIDANPAKWEEDEYYAP